MSLAMVGIAIPNFVMAPLLTLVFGVYARAGCRPAAGAAARCQFLVLPVIVAGPAADGARRAADARRMIEVLHANYVRTARAKGLRERLVVLRHALRGAMLPLVSYLGPATRGTAHRLASWSRQIFSIPGIGRYFVQAALNRDYTVVMGVVIVYAALIILLNLVVDLLYGLLDPRVRQRLTWRSPAHGATGSRCGAEVEGRSLWEDARRRLFRNKAAVVAMVLLALHRAGAPIFAPWLSAHPFDEIYWDQIGVPPDLCRRGHWFGTDNIGRDLFVRVLYGARVSLAVGVVGDAGQPGDRRRLGRGRRLRRRPGRRADDALRRHPLLAAVHLLRDHADGRVRPQHHPDVRGHRRGGVADHGAHRARPDAVGEAARSSSRRRARRAFAPAASSLRHIVPNVLGPVVVYVTLTMPEVILTESFLSFLGLGVQEPLHLLGRADLRGRRPDGDARPGC